MLLPIYGPGTSIQLPGCLAAAKMNGRAGAVPHLRGPLIKSPAHLRRSVLHIYNLQLTKGDLSCISIICSLPQAICPAYLYSAACHRRSVLHIYILQLTKGGLSCISILCRLPNALCPAYLYSVAYQTQSVLHIYILQLTKGDLSCISTFCSLSKATCPAFLYYAGYQVCPRVRPHFRFGSEI